MPIRARIALFGAGVVFLTVVIFSVLVYTLVNHSVLQQQDATLTRRSVQFSGGPRDGAGGAFCSGGGFPQPLVVHLLPRRGHVLHPPPRRATALPPNRPT